MSVAGVLFGAAVLVFVASAVVFLSNRWNRPKYSEVSLSGALGRAELGNTVEIATWNIGYGALGKRADFLIDGGKNLRVLNKGEITEATEQIAAKLRSFHSDVLLLQEVARPSFLTRGVDVRSAVEHALDSYSGCFWADFKTVLVPPPLRIEHGMSVFTKNTVSACEILKLPQDPKYHYGFLKKYYAGMIAKHPIRDSEHSWIIINIHLSAFDPEASIRKTQIEALFDYATREYAAGNHVVIGGDWNTRMAEAEFPHTTAREHLFWIYDFPFDVLPEGWKFGINEKVPTVRTLQKSYVPGENYTMVIDGFIVSPNVRVDEVHGQDYGFEHTDHHPVLARFTATGG
ncbi:MAG: endonuclease/exonuclease/phosphatase family protein [Rhodobacteraceae bacterium]|nr:endonuclease/exonuclease/phosphatase family protein [Paracoccaceae bacterium]